MIRPSPRKRRLRILEFIRGCIASNGEAPTIAEIGRRFDLKSSASVYNVLVKLETEGLIKRSRKWRGIEIVDA
jgi:SOS-response transcriptional repressor LexA